MGDLSHDWVFADLMFISQGNRDRSGDGQRPLRVTSSRGDQRFGAKAVHAERRLSGTLGDDVVDSLRAIGRHVGQFCLIFSYRCTQ